MAFQLISAGVYGYPQGQALQVAADSIREFLRDSDMTVYMVLFDWEAYQLSREMRLTAEK